MPMKRHLYPDNWDDIALAIKQKADWKCTECGLNCLPVKKAMTRSERAKRTLTVHHIDKNPANNLEENLVALCAGCHLRRHKK